MTTHERSDYKQRLADLRALVGFRRERPLTVVVWPECQLPGSSEVAGMRTAIDFLHDQGWATHHETDSRRTNSGFPDLVAVRPPEILVVEFKVGRNKLATEQGWWRDDLLACPGVTYLVCYLDQPASWRAFLAAATR